MPPIITKQVETFFCPVCHKGYINYRRLPYDQHIRLVQRHVSSEHPGVPNEWYALYATRRTCDELRRKVIP